MYSPFSQVTKLPTPTLPPFASKGNSQDEQTNQPGLDLCVRFQPDNRIRNAAIHEWDHLMQLQGVDPPGICGREPLLKTLTHGRPRNGRPAVQGHTQLPITTTKKGNYEWQTPNHHNPKTRASQVYPVKQSPKSPTISAPAIPACIWSRLKNSGSRLKSRQLPSN